MVDLFELYLKAENKVSSTSCHNRVSEPVWRAVHLCVYDPFWGKVRNLSSDNLCVGMMQDQFTFKA